ncbi:hypothetical protein ACJX0J_036301, partial [Zea mays]
RASATTHGIDGLKSVLCYLHVAFCVFTIKSFKDKRKKAILSHKNPLFHQKRHKMAFHLEQIILGGGRDSVMLEKNILDIEELLIVLVVATIVWSSELKSFA